jgi:hypothetical protein
MHAYTAATAAAMRHDRVFRFIVIVGLFDFVLAVFCLGLYIGGVR